VEFKEGEKVWVHQLDGSVKPAIFVGEGELTAWFGGPPQVYVVYPETKSGEAVDEDRVTPREDS
jgi:hypothetical protein